MNPVSTIKSVLDLIQIPFNLVRAHNEVSRKFRNKLESLVDELDLIKEESKIHDELQLMELVYDIEDFVQGLWIPKASGPVLSVIAVDPREEYLGRIDFFMDKITKLKKLQQKSTECKSEQGGSCGADTTSRSDPSSSSAAGGFTPEKLLVGISEAKKVLLDLLETPASGGQDAKKQPNVISIVGCPGVGKTALARAVYDHARTSDDFEFVVWVEATGCNDKTTLLAKIQADLASWASGTPDLHVILAYKRYLVFIDDVQQANKWDNTVLDFPRNGRSSFVVVTTSDHSVANVCSSRPGSYVYRMQCLPLEESEKLFWKHVYLGESDPSVALREDSKSIINKCDGLPLALTSVAKYLRTKNGKELDGTTCVTMDEKLGSHLVDGDADEAFWELRKALGQCYGGLLHSDHKTCMLSLSIFPRKHPIKSKSLVRRLVAEGLIGGDGKEHVNGLIKVIDHGRQCLEGLVNRCIVEPVETCNWSKDAKSCRVNCGIMLEFIIHKSRSINLVTLIRGKEVVWNPKGCIRRVSVQSSSKDKVDEIERKYEMSKTIRSLTIIPSEDNSELFNIKNIKSCKLLRVLDLEGARGLDKEFFCGICELVYLKYLSLRKTDVKIVPQEIENLQCLQTLDIRETRKIKLPEEVITLPKLAFLFGWFVLPNMSNKTKKFLSTESELHTFAGFDVDKEQDFDHSILKARNLRKVEVRHSPPQPQTSSKKKIKSVCSKVFKLNSPTGTKKDFIPSLQRYFTSLESVSIHSDQLGQDILASLDTEISRCTIRRMKLLSKLTGLPRKDTLCHLNNLRKLQLSNTGLTIEQLSTLQVIPGLEYLKLHDNETDSWGGSFLVSKDGFPSLRWLCFHASKLPKLEFVKESMKSLTSLHMLCQDFSNMQAVEEISENISHISKFDEVVLDHSASRAIVEAWETASKNNVNRPRVSQRPSP